MLTNFQPCHVQDCRKILTSHAILILTYLQLSYLLTQLIYARTKSPQKNPFLFCKAWKITNDCVSASKILTMGVKLMTERYKKNTYMKSKGECKDKCHKKNSYIFFHNNDCKTPYIQIFIDFLSINFNLLSIRQHYAYHQISDFEIYTSLATILQLNALFFLT